jgi:hypothetical protein
MVYSYAFTASGSLIGAAVRSSLARYSAVSSHLPCTTALDLRSEATAPTAILPSALTAARSICPAYSEAERGRLGEEVGGLLAWV